MCELPTECLCWCCQSSFLDQKPVFVLVLPASCRPLGLRSEDLLGTRRDKMNAGAGLADIDPMAIDQSVSVDMLCIQTMKPSVRTFRGSILSLSACHTPVLFLISYLPPSLLSFPPQVGFDSIGGLSGHISALKEMVVFPLLYPEVFDNFKIQPPRWHTHTQMIQIFTEFLYIRLHSWTKKSKWAWVRTTFHNSRFVNEAAKN